MKKHKWKSVILFMVTVVITVVGSLLITPIYRASSRLLVKPGREDVYVPPTAGSPPIITRLGQKVNAEVAILKSPSLVMQLVDRFGVQRLYSYPDRTLKGWLFKKGIFKETKKREIPPIEKAYGSLQESLDVSGTPRSNVINISFAWPDPVIAAQVVNTFVDLYFVQRVKVRTDPQTYNFVKDQTEQWRKKLEKSEKDLEVFKRRHSITSLSDQKTMTLSKLAEFESQQNQIESEIQETAEMIASFKGQLSNQDENVQRLETVNRRSPTLAALKARLIDLEFQGLKEEINRVKQMITEEEKKERAVVVSGENPLHQSLEVELLKAKTHLKVLKTMEKNRKLQVAAYQEQLKTLDRLENQMKELARRVAINEENYRLYLTKFEEAKISQSMDRQKIASVSVIEPAYSPLKPIKPKKRKIVMAGGFLGLFAAVGMAFFIEMINPVFRTREDVDQFLGLPVLATLPKEK
jgi:uncharacterized protein involved in exopolysaccharide biosynthesis